MEENKLMGLVAEGKIVIPSNRLHTCLDVNGIGSMLKTKINVNLGTSRDCVDLNMELEKVNDAVSMGAESIMDLSSFGDTQQFRRKLTSESPAIIGTVPIYDAVVYYHKPLKEITAEEWIQIVEMHAKDGAAFLCYVTPAEHLRLPDVNDVKEGIIALKIAAHAADIAKGIKGTADWDHQMSTARKNLDWEAMFDLSIDPEKARRYRILEGKIVNIYEE